MRLCLFVISLKVFRGCASSCATEKRLPEQNQTEEKRSWRRWAKIILPLTLGAVCLYYILTVFAWAEIWRVLQTVNVPLFLTASIFATLIFWLLRAVRWMILLRGTNLEISFFKLYLYTAITIGFANFTPFQAGEAFKVELFRKYGGNRFSGYNYFVLEKLLDLATISALAVVGVSVLFEKTFGGQIQWLIAALIGGLLILSAIVVFILKRSARNGEQIAPDYKNLAFALAVTLASWALMIAGWKLIFQSAAIDLSLLQTSAVVSLTTIVGIIIFVPGAIGVSEISIAILLAQLGYSTAIAQTGAVLIAIYSLVILLLTVFHLIILKIVNGRKRFEHSQN